MRYQYPILGGISVVAVLVIIYAADVMTIPQNTRESDSFENTIVESAPIVSQEQDASQIQEQGISQIQDEPKFKIQVTKGVKHIIPLDKIKSGGVPKDGIPSIDRPDFATASDANFMSDNDLVLGLIINGEARAYPLFILVWHEIVNDIVGGIPVAVTYCPLCFTNQVFESTVNGQVTEFGVSGKLYNSNLVMYDRNTDSQWSQAMGMAITGELAGYELNRIPFDVASWSDWKSLYPETLVLTTKTGHLRAYGSDPYTGYYTDPRIIFPVENRDDRLHPKEIILGFDEGNTYKAYKLADVEEKKVINDHVGDKNLLLVSLYPQMARAFSPVVDGNILEFEYVDGKIVDTQTNSQWNFDGEAVNGQLMGTKLEREVFSPGFWFEWVAFYPDTLLYPEA